MMKKTIFLLVLMTIIGNSMFAQSSSDQTTSTVSPEQNRFEATIICLDAIEAPTKYNAFAKEFIQLPSFPKKTNIISQENYKTEIKTWLIANPSMTDKILEARKEAHDKLYGPRPY